LAILCSVPHFDQIRWNSGLARGAVALDCESFTVSLRSCTSLYQLRRNPVKENSLDRVLKKTTEKVCNAPTLRLQERNSSKELFLAKELLSEYPHSNSKAKFS
jgi:hypothetical protein